MSATDPNPPTDVAANSGCAPAAGSARMFYVKEATHAGVYKFEDGRELVMMRSETGWKVTGIWGENTSTIALTHEAMNVLVGAVLGLTAPKSIRMVILPPVPNSDSSTAGGVSE